MLSEGQKGIVVYVLCLANHSGAQSRDSGVLLEPKAPTAQDGTNSPTSMPNT